jgi:hypothetical protein
VDESPESTPFVNEIVWKQQNQVMGRAQTKKQVEDYRCQNQTAFRGITLNNVFDYCMVYFEGDSSGMCVWMYKGWATKTTPCTMTFEDLLCFPFWLPLINRTPQMKWNLIWATALQSHRMCVADSSSSRHLSRVGSWINPNWKGALLGDIVL